MTRSCLLTILLFLCFSEINAQKAIQKMSDDACKCINKNKKNEDLAGETILRSCIEDALIANFTLLKEEMGVETVEDIDLKLMSEQLGLRMVKDCSALTELLSREIDEVPADSLDSAYQKALPVKKENCRQFLQGEFYYAVQIDLEGTMDTTLVTIKNGLYVERMDRGETFSLLSFKWSGDCVCELSFVESNHPHKSVMSKKGDKYYYTIVDLKEDRAILKTMVLGTPIYIEMIRR